MEKQSEKKKKQNSGRTMLIRSLISGGVILALLVAFSYAWFAGKADITTLVNIKAPTAIAILGPHGEAQTSLDMSYTDEDVDADGRVTIRRVVSVSSDASEHQLEIVHTTNLKGLTFKIYKADEVESAPAGSGSITEKDYTYTFDKSKPLEGSYINLKSTGNNYKYADNSMHDKNFESYQNVQSHAEPLYWVASGAQEAKVRDESNTNVQTKYLTYYIIEISWEDTTKETDMFYLLARNR